MSGIAITLEGGGDCRIEHASGTVLRTSKSAAFGGSGRSFSSTDLLAVALGSCVATDMEPVAVRHGLPLGEIRIEVDKDVSVKPKQVRALRVRVSLPPGVDDMLLVKLERAAGHCLVHRSLHPDVVVTITLERRAT